MALLAMWPAALFVQGLRALRERRHFKPGYLTQVTAQTDRRRTTQ